MSMRTLIEAEALASLLGDARLRVFDCRFDLARPAYGRAAYAEEHVPGAIFADLNADLSAPATATSGRHPLPAPEEFAARLRAWGVNADSRVVLRWLGHDDVAVLDGGMRRWLQLGLPLSEDVPAPVPGNFIARPRPAMAVSAPAVLEAASDPSARILDARAPERYRGEVEPIDKVAGHVPGARNHPFGMSLDSQGRFLPPQVLRDTLAASLDGVAPESAIVYCGSGVTACHVLLALEHAGLAGARLYPGSWSEWSRDPSRPVATGATP